MKSPAQDMADLLITSELGIGTAVGTDIFLNSMPDRSNDSKNRDYAIALYNTGGDDQDGAMDDDGKDITNPTVMIQVRDSVNKYDETYELARNIQESLHRRTGDILNGSRYMQILAQGDVLRIGRDDNNRPMFSINFRLKRTPI